jgi:hypothetical protein
MNNKEREREREREKTSSTLGAKEENTYVG